MWWCNRKNHVMILAEGCADIIGYGTNKIARQGVGSDKEPTFLDMILWMIPWKCRIVCGKHSIEGGGNRLL